MVWEIANYQSFTRIQRCHNPVCAAVFTTAPAFGTHSSRQLPTSKDKRLLWAHRGSQSNNFGISPVCNARHSSGWARREDGGGRSDSGHTKTIKRELEEQRGAVICGRRRLDCRRVPPMLWLAATDPSWKQPTAPPSGLSVRGVWLFVLMSGSVFGTL